MYGCFVEWDHPISSQIYDKRNEEVVVLGELVELLHTKMVTYAAVGCESEMDKSQTTS